jgi:hypothetical protein
MPAKYARYIKYLSGCDPVAGWTIKRGFPAAIQRLSTVERCADRATRKGEAELYQEVTKRCRPASAARITAPAYFTRAVGAVPNGHGGRTGPHSQRAGSQRRVSWPKPKGDDSGRAFLGLHRRRRVARNRSTSDCSWAGARPAPAGAMRPRPPVSGSAPRQLLLRVPSADIGHGVPAQAQVVAGGTPDGFTNCRRPSNSGMSVTALPSSSHARQLRQRICCRQRCTAAGGYANEIRPCPPGGSPCPPLGGSAWATVPGSVSATSDGSTCPTLLAHLSGAR